MDHDDNPEIEVEHDQAAEASLRDIVSYARAEAAEHRTTDAIRGRSMAIVATKIEEALFYLVYKVP